MRCLRCRARRRLRRTRAHARGAVTGDGSAPLATVRSSERVGLRDDPLHRALFDGLVGATMSERELSELAIHADARSGLNGLSTIPKESAQRGDLILFNYIGPPRKVSHVGLVTAAGGGGIGTVEGNTNTPSVVATRISTGWTTGRSSRSSGSAG